MNNVGEPASIPWHQLLGTLLELTLTPVDIQVETEVQVMSEPPKADILLLRRKTSHWTDKQRALLPDGIRQSRAGHQLLEFKYSESVSEESLAQAIAYEYFYRTARRLGRKDVQVWLISSRTPRRSRLQAWGYAETGVEGVYQSSTILVNRVGLLALNQLSPESYNAFIKMFASRQDEKENAFQHYWQVEVLEPKAKSFIRGLREIVEVKEDSAMTIVITPEYVMRRGEEITRMLLDSLTTEERLAGLKIEDRLAGLEPEQVLAGLKPEERVAGLKPEERVAGLKPEERVAGLKPEERVAGLDPDEILSQISIEEIEAYLERHRSDPKDSATTEE